MPKTTIGERLRDALTHGRMGYRALGKELRKKGVRGASDRTIAYYLAGRSTPSVLWTTATAEVLGVSASWLSLGEGHMDPARPKTDTSEVYHAAIAAIEGLKAGLSYTTDLTVGASLMLAIKRFVQAHHAEPGWPKPETMTAYAEHVLGPLTFMLLHAGWTFDDRSDQTDRKWVDLRAMDPEVLRRVLTGYLELFALLSPKKAGRNDEEREERRNWATEGSRGGERWPRIDFAWADRGAADATRDKGDS